MRILRQESEPPPLPRPASREGRAFFREVHALALKAAKTQVDDADAREIATDIARRMYEKREKDPSYAPKDAREGIVGKAVSNECNKLRGRNDRHDERQLKYAFEQWDMEFPRAGAVELLSDENPEADLLRNEKIGLLRRAITRVSEPRRSVALLIAGGAKHKEVAEQLHIPMGSVPGHFYRAIKDLEGLLRAYEANEALPPELAALLRTEEEP